MENMQHIHPVFCPHDSHSWNEEAGERSAHPQSWHLSLYIKYGILSCNFFCSGSLCKVTVVLYKIFDFVDIVVTVVAP